MDRLTNIHRRAHRSRHAQENHLIYTVFRQLSQIGGSTPGNALNAWLQFTRTCVSFEAGNPIGKGKVLYARVATV